MEINSDDINWDSFDNNKYCLLRYHNFDFIAILDENTNCFYSNNPKSEYTIPVFYRNLTDSVKSKVNFNLKSTLIGYVYTYPRCYLCGEVDEIQQICNHCLRRSITTT